VRYGKLFLQISHRHLLIEIIGLNESVKVFTVTPPSIHALERSGSSAVFIYKQ